MTNPYPSILLNELHHHFPALLYRPDSFQTVQDVLGYIIHTAQRNPYEYGESLYSASFTTTASTTASTAPTASTASNEEMKQPCDPISTASTATASTATASTATASTATASTATASTSTSSASSPLVNEAEQLLRALFQRRSPITRPANRFRISMPLDLSDTYSLYSSSRPDILQSLSQFSSDLMRPVIVRPSEGDLARNTYVYRSEVPHNENCSICQEPMEAEQETRTILACSHCFHCNCIDTWFQEHVQCPTCRHDVRES